MTGGRGEAAPKLDMTGMRVVLFGATGQVGRELQVALARTELIALDRAAADLRDPAAVRAAVRHHRPTVVINAAAHTAVDQAESEPELAVAVNATAAEAMAIEAKSLDATLVYFSSDYVYDGTKSGPYIEGDVANPLSVYGRTKLAGERATALCPRHVIFRTSWVVSAHGTNFVKTMLRLAAERDTLRVVADQHGVPTSAALIARVTAAVLEAMRNAPADDPRWGIYHVVPAGETNWNELARYVTARAREHGFALRATPQTVTAIRTHEYPSAARRPANSRLDTTKLQSTFHIELPDWRKGVDEVLLEMASADRFHVS